MADRDLPADDPALVVAARHALHDEELIAAFAVEGDTADDAGKARGLVERCAACRGLHADLVAIRSGLRAGGSAAAFGVFLPAPRDFRLTAADAARLRPRRRLDRIAAAVLGGIATFGRPVGATLATFGVVGLLVGSVALGPMAGSPASGPGAAFATRGPGAEDQGGVGGNLTPATGDMRTSEDVLAPLASGGRETSPRLTPMDNAVPGPTAASWLLAGSLVILVLGVALIVGGTRSRRRDSAHART